MRNLVRPEERLILVVGGYGSGKTEVCVNLAIGLARSGRRVQIADLDIVNPYFRCREARALMEQHEIRVVVPPGAQAFADLPIIVREIGPMLRPDNGTISIFDVGGDDVGARALASFRSSITDYQLWHVINSKRPFSNTVDGCRHMQHAVEKASRLEVTGLIANSHLIEETTPDTVLEGWHLARDVAKRSGLPVRSVALMDELADSDKLGEIDAPLLRMRRRMLPPWIAPDSDSPTAFAPRPVPLGKAVPTRFHGGGDGQDHD